MVNKYIPALLLVIQLVGCGPWIHIPSKVPDQLDSLRSSVIPGKTLQHEVHEKLGKPFISGGSLRVEVYRVAIGYEADVHFAIIPVWLDTEEVIIYALVVYDENSVVQSIDWDVYQDDKQVMGVFRSAKLHADGFYFAAFNLIAPFKTSRKEMLLGPPSSNQSALTRLPPPGKCAVLFFLDVDESEPNKGLLDGELYINDKSIVNIPPTESAYWYWAPHSWKPYYRELFVRSLLVEGEYEFKITTQRKPSEFRRKLLCTDKSIFYVYPEFELVKTEPWGFWRSRYKYEGRIAIYNEPLNSHKDWKQILFYNGRWLGED